MMFENVQQIEESPVATQPVAETITPKRKYTAPVNPAPAEEPKLSKARFARAAKEKTENGGSAAAGRGTQTKVMACKPDKQWWVRCHPSPEMVVTGLTILILKSGGSEETYVLDPEIDFPEDLYAYTTPASVTRAITSQNNEFLWLSKLSPKSPKESVRICQAAAKKKWIQVRWNGQTKSYNYFDARELRREPTWSDDTMDDLLEKAFGDHFINRRDHEVINKLLFPDDGDCDE
jgi:hypothetical protein